MWSRWGFVLLQKQCLLWFWVTWSTLFSSLFSQHWHWPRALCADPPAAFKGQQSTAWLHSLHEAIPGSHGISGISQASHIFLERLLITRHSLSIIITQILKKKIKRKWRREKRKKNQRQWISRLQLLHGDTFNCLPNSHHWAYPQHPPALTHLSGEVVEVWCLKGVWASKKEKENMPEAIQGW